MFTTGRIIFIVFFVLLFVSGMVYAYRKDAKVNAIHFKKSFLILIAIILIFSLLFLLVKIRN